jgi:hypothetical protein
MKPAHIIGGPAMFNAMIELYRYFPELKQSLSRTLKAFISIGAPFAKETARQLKICNRNYFVQCLWHYRNIDGLNKYGGWNRIRKSITRSYIWLKKD